MKRGLYILGACVLSILIFSECKKNMQESQPEEVAVMNQSVAGEDDSEEKVAYLTFDDGPSEVTPEILDTLEKKKAKATICK